MVIAFCFSSEQTAPYLHSKNASNTGLRSLERYAVNLYLSDSNHFNNETKNN